MDELPPDDASLTTDVSAAVNARAGVNQPPPPGDASLSRQVGCTICSYSVSRWLADGELIRLGGTPPAPELAPAATACQPHTGACLGRAAAGLGMGGERAGEEEDVLEVIHTPGHTPDSICLWLPREKILFVGDILYPYAAVLLAAPHSDLRQYVASIQMLHRRFGGAAAGVTLACGHVAGDVDASDALSTMASLAGDVLSGAAAPPPSRDLGPGGSAAAEFRRAEYELLVRVDDAALVH